MSNNTAIRFAHISTAKEETEVTALQDEIDRRKAEIVALRKERNLVLHDMDGLVGTSETVRRLGDRGFVISLDGLLKICRAVKLTIQGR